MTDSKNNVWVSINNAGIARLDDGTNTWTLFNSANSGFSNQLPDRSLCEDHLGNIWAGFDQDDGIVAMYDGTSWTSEQS